MRVVQTIGVPRMDLPVPQCDAVVVSLKTRTAPVDRAVASSLQAVRWMVKSGIERFFFKYCSTFDSRPEGNIGPVGDALMDELNAPYTVACPAFPETGRTVYLGHLFVGEVPLNESSMAHHPMTPMTDSSIIRLLEGQTSRRVALVGYPAIQAGAETISRSLQAAAREGARHIVLDALDDTHLRSIGEAVVDLQLVTGASGIARGLPDALRRRGILAAARQRPSLSLPDGPIAILAGSASPATRIQVQRFAPSASAVVVDALRLARGTDLLETVIAAAIRGLGQRPVLVHIANTQQDVGRVQAELGVEDSADMLEASMAKIAVALVSAGARRLVVAGGETSAAVVEALGITALRIGPEIAPGVPWCEAVSEPVIALALKSGNFGGPDFFTDAIAALS